jgi:hypothetical protein
VAILYIRPSKNYSELYKALISITLKPSDSNFLS